MVDLNSTLNKDNKMHMGMFDWDDDSGESSGGSGSGGSGGNNNNNNKKNGMKSMLACLVVALLLTGMVGLVAQKYRTGEVQEIKYSEFLKMLEDGKIESVTLSSSKVTVTPKDQTNAKSKVTYYAVLAPDYDIVDRLHKAGVTFEEVQESNWSQILWYIVPFILFWGFLIFMTRNISKGGGIMGVGKSNAKLYVEDKTGVTFADVAGQDEANESLTEMVDFLHNPDKYTQIGAKLPKGALLVGPPGTGKTLLAKAVAGEAGVPFFSLSGSSFVEMYVGVGASRVRDLFKEAQKMAPCIIFIDEIDAIGKSRDQAMGNDEREQTLNQLLTEMDGFDAAKGLVILAATNRPESLDKALLRPGRFDRRIIMELPDLEGRKAILKVHLKDVKHGDIDLDAVGRATAGSSGADIANIVNEAALRAVRLGKNQVDTEDLEESVETVIAGEQKKGAIIAPEEKRIISYHEIGHAMVAACQTHSAPVQKITIVPRTSGALGYTMQVDEGEKHLMSKQEMLNRIATLTGGRAAEEVMCHTCTTGASNDIEKATQLARAMITTYGMSDNYGMMQLEQQSNRYLGGRSSLVCSEQTAHDIDKEVRDIIAQAHEKAVKIITAHAKEMDEAASILLKKETITGDEFMQVLSGHQHA